MKVLVTTPKEDKEIIFPCLMIADDLMIVDDLMIADDNMIILATGYKSSGKYAISGTLLDPGNKHSLPIGHYSDSWSSNCFKPVPSGVSITLMP